MKPLQHPLFMSFVLVMALTACGGRQSTKQAEFRADTPFSARVQGQGEDVCWSVKRAFLTQGYMIDRGSDAMIMTGTKDTQPDEDTNISLRLQATCVDNRDGTSTVFASAAQEVHKLQKVSYSTTTGVSIATISLPSGTDRSLRLQSRETIQDPKFYQSFYSLVQKFAEEERRSASAQPRR